MANDRAVKVVLGTKTATSAPIIVGFREDVEFPPIGGQATVQDGEGHPVAVIETTATAVRAWAEVDEEYAKLEGYASLTEWRKFKEEAYRREGIFHEGISVFCWTFRLVRVLAS